MWELVGGWCPGKELDLCPGSGEWDDQIMITLDGPDKDGPEFVKGIVPTINTKALGLVGVHQRVIQFGATMKCFICNQNACLSSSWVIPGSGPGHNWCI